MSDLSVQEGHTRRLLGIVLPDVETLVRLMHAEGDATPAETFRLLLGLDPEHPPAIEAAKYLPHVVRLRGLFGIYGGMYDNATALELALARAADLTASLL